MALKRGGGGASDCAHHGICMNCRRALCAESPGSTGAVRLVSHSHCQAPVLVQRRCQQRFKVQRREWTNATGPRLLDDKKMC